VQRTPSSSSEAFETTAIAPLGSQPQLPPADLEVARWIGATLDHFVIERALGKGGMGAVYLAHDTSLDRMVAVKVLPSALAARADLQERFVREARAQARLASPHVVHIYFIGHGGEGAQSLYFAMEHVDGGSLEPAEGAEPMDPEEARALMIQVASGLRDAHKAGIIHRDIKPSNLLRNAAGDVKIADFGLAKPVESDKKLTQEGAVMGSPLYIAPEQARGDEVDHRADMYSLGCTFHHLLAGSPPYDGPTPIAIVAKHLEAPPPPLSTRAPHVPAPLAGVVERLMSKDPAERYASYDALIAALEACAPGATSYAGFWTRGAAALLDAGIAFGVVYAMGGVGLGLMLVYLTVVHAYFGQTVGKRLLRIEVQRTNGARLGLPRAAARTLASMWMPFVVGFMLLMTGGVPLLRSVLERVQPAELQELRTFAVAVAASNGVLTLLYAAGLALAAFHPQKRAAHDLIVGSQVVYRLHEPRRKRR
jgi:uncharacterized RDD family membrane protein YckC